MRLDSYLFEKGYYSSRTKSMQAIEKSQVLVNGKVVKPSFEVFGNEKIEIVKKQEFVSLGGYKLEKAINDFNYLVDGKVFADIGASTGGFTDCLLKRGAKRVYAIDVGENQLDESLKNNEKIVVIDRFNARNITSETLEEKVDCAVVDCSFISLKTVLKPITNCLKDDGEVIALVKPQFECGKSALSSSGIVKSKKLRLNALVDIFDFVLSLNLGVLDVTNAPVIKGKNVEYLILISKTKNSINREKYTEIISGLGE